MSRDLNYLSDSEFDDTMQAAFDYGKAYAHKLFEATDVIEDPDVYAAVNIRAMSDRYAVVAERFRRGMRCYVPAMEYIPQR